MTSDAAPGRHNMGHRVTRGMAWVGASQVTMQLTRMAVAIVVARLLTPGEYGLAAAALVFASLVLVFSDLAFGAALVQRKTLTEDDRSTAFWITVSSGVVFTVGGYLLAGSVASLYGEPDVAPLMAALSFSFVLTAIGATQQSLLLREMNFRRLELMTMAGSLPSSSPPTTPISSSSTIRAAAVCSSSAAAICRFSSSGIAEPSHMCDWNSGSCPASKRCCEIVMSGRT